jgi:hypothetical protein
MVHTSFPHQYGPSFTHQCGERKIYIYIYIYIHIMLVTSWVLLLCGMLRMLGLASEGEVSGSLRTRGS